MTTVHTSAGSVATQPGPPREDPAATTYDERPNTNERTIRNSPWIGFAVRRSLALVGTCFALVLLSFLIVQLIPGDPAEAIAGPDATKAEVDLVRSELGLDRPLAAQFFSYIGQLLHGDLGISTMYEQPVDTIISARLPFTVSIAACGIALVLVTAIPIGMAVGVVTRGGRHRRLDTAFTVVTGILDSIPGYIMATVMVLLFGMGVGLLPLFPPAYSPNQPMDSLLLPTVALAVGPACTVARVVRRETAVILEHDHIRTARGWRLSALRIHLGHVLPNLVATSLTLCGLVLSGMIGGALIIESVFALPGIGSGIVKAIVDRDYPVIRGMVLVIGVIAALVNLIVDIVIGLLDPRSLGDKDATDA
ncbi:ABC transporter permease [Rhodococcus sp. NPDC003348]